MRSTKYQKFKFLLLYKYFGQLLKCFSHTHTRTPDTFTTYSSLIFYLSIPKPSFAFLDRRSKKVGYGKNGNNISVTQVISVIPIFSIFVAVYFGYVAELVHPAKELITLATVLMVANTGTWYRLFRRFAS